MSVADVSVADVSVADVSVADVSVADVSVADASVADASVADASVADVSVADVSVADVSVADVSVADVSVADASVADASVADREARCGWAPRLPRPPVVASRAPRCPQGYPLRRQVVQDDQVHPRLVTTDDWPEPELRAAVLAGELVAVGPCWASPAEPQTPALRAEAVSWALRGRRLVACALTAAWIWGAVSRPPDPLEVCFPPGGRGRIDPTLRLREGRLADGDLIRLGPLPVTTPLRTAVDLLRTGDFATAEHLAVTGLLGVGAVRADELRTRLGTLGVVPMVRQAERRLRIVEREAADR